MAEALASRIIDSDATPRNADKLRVALLTNEIFPYREPLLQELSEQFGSFRVLVSSPHEMERPRPDSWSVDVVAQHTLELNRVWRHPLGFRERNPLHFPYDTLWQLESFHPHVVISGELGLRTVQSVLYRRWRPESRLIMWALLSEHTEQGRGALRDRLRAWLLPQADVVVANGQSGARYIRRFGIPDTNIVLAQQATLVDAFSAVGTRRNAAQAQRLLYVGQLIQRKGLQPFFHVLAQWGLNHPSRQVELWLAGEGPLRAELQAFPMPANVACRFLGTLSYADLPRVYGQAGVFVFPTLADEWGMVVNEALAAGVPVLGSTYSQAVEELIRPGGNGWTFTPDRADEMYNALDRALSTSPEQLDLMRQAAQHSIRYLGPRRMAQSLMNAVETAISR